MTPEECAELIVSGTEREYVKGLLDYVLERYNDLDLTDPQVYYRIQRIYDLMPSGMSQIYLQDRDAILAEAERYLTEAAMDADTEKAMQEYSGHTPGLMYSYQYQRLHESTVKGCMEIINRDNVDLINNMAQKWYETSIKAVSQMSVYQKGPGAIIEEGVRSMNGITDITYKSGAKYPIDSAIRRHIETQLNQNHQRLTEMRAAEYGWDLFMCSSHSDCRPTHYDFQGQVFSKGDHIGETIDGHLVWDYDEMGIGNVAGIYGANCRHYVTPYVPGWSEPQEPPYDEATNAERYDLTQKQRARERTLRKDKLELYAAEKSGDPEAIAQARLQVRKEQKSIREFCKENDLVRRYDLEKAYPVNGGN